MIHVYRPTPPSGSAAYGCASQTPENYWQGPEKVDVLYLTWACAVVHAPLVGADLQTWLFMKHIGLTCLLDDASLNARPFLSTGFNIC